MRDLWRVEGVFQLEFVRLCILNRLRGFRVETQTEMLIELDAAHLPDRMEKLMHRFKCG